MQGFNMGRYVPPEHEGTTSANKLAGKHALGSRARKSTQGILTVRFEMPFAIWCTTCLQPTIIGQGVRFNAEKKKIGAYYTSPIYQFRIKHTVCGGPIEIRTDPQNTAYVVVSGAKKRDTGDDVVREGDMVVRSKEERDRMEEDAFAALEGRVEDKTMATGQRARIEELYERGEKDWGDPYKVSRIMRRGFRAERKVREKMEGEREALKERVGWGEGMEILEENEEDRRRAGMVDFGEEGWEKGIKRIKAKALFDEEGEKGSGSEKRRKSRSKGVKESELRREKLVKELRDNTRAAMDPFLAAEKTFTSTPPALGIKRKRNTPTGDLDASKTIDQDSDPKRALLLVDYDSD